jgi:acetyltransferase-like isoleucine patch superfamily enzyme
MKQKLDLDTTSSEHHGIKGLFERLLRRFKTAMYIFTMLPVYLFACFVLAASLTPSVALFRFLQNFTSQSSTWLQNASFAFSLAAGYFLYGTSLVIIAPVLNKLFVGKLKAWRGNYYSAESLKWFLHNGFTYLARFTFLEFVTPSPLSLFFYRAMGMKIGEGTIINSTWISDPSLIEMKEKVTIGGSVTIVAHYGQGGMLVIAPVKIGAKCTIGLKATIMGGCEIGDGAKLLPHSVLLPKTKVPPGETWGGVPAQKIDIRKLYADNSDKEAA